MDMGWEAMLSVVAPFFISFLFFLGGGEVSGRGFHCARIERADVQGEQKNNWYSKFIIA